ncbi:MAG: transporter [Methyloceanibacter sp.]
MTFLSMPRAAKPALTLCLGTLIAVFSHAAQADSPPGSPPLADQHAPAGVMFEHMHKAGEFMLGFKYAYSSAGGDTLHGTSTASDKEIVDKGCSPHLCSMTPSEMRMNMYMLDIMYAPADWLTLMVMPMWMSHDMTMRPVGGMSHAGHMEMSDPMMADDMMHGDMDMAGHDEGSGHMHMGSHGTPGFGDTTFGPMVRLLEGPGYGLHTGLMFSAPTGSVDKQMQGTFTHYGMQPGSGTWDFLPSLTYRGRADRLTWGAQLLGTIRMESENESGYQLGDVFQATGWGSYRFANWISASVRGLYTEQGKIEGHYNGPHGHSSPADLQFNYGGRFFDIGFGVNTVVQAGTLKGLRLSAEWLQPVEDDPNGYQLEREGTLWADASISF